MLLQLILSCHHYRLDTPSDTDEEDTWNIQQEQKTPWNLPTWPKDASVEHARILQQGQNIHQNLPTWLKDKPEPSDMADTIELD